MVDRTGNESWLRGLAERAIHACKLILRYHWESYGKLRNVTTWLVGLAVTVVFLLIAFMIFPCPTALSAIPNFSGDGVR